MGLTKPRAHQLQDIDYKQTARAVTTSNITLSGGAPATVDGVSLALRDRVLVTGQSTGSENGIYYVTTVGAGSNGTWARSLDADTTGEVSAGMIIMVTEGTTYADTQWKLTTDDPITIGTTSLTFVRAGNAAYGTVAVSGEDSIVADAIGDTLTIVAGTNLALTTNASTDTLTITPSLTPSLTSVTATGTITASGNITGGNIITAGTVDVDRLSLTSSQTTVSPLQLTANSLQDGVGALRIDGSQADIFLNPATATHTTVTFAVNNDQRLAFGMDNNSDFYITRRTGGSWYDDTFVIDRDTGELRYGYDLSVTGDATANNISVTNFVGSNLIPSANATYNLGSATNQWNEVHIAGSTLYLGDLQLKDSGGNTFTVFASDGTTPAEVTGNIAGANVSGAVANATYADSSGTAATVTTAAQPNITSVGTLTSVTTSGNISTDGIININDRQGLYLHDSDSSHYVALVPPATVTGNVTFTLPGDSGTADYVLATNGAGTLSWVEQSGGGSSGASSFPNSTVTPLPSSEGNFDLSYNYAQTTQETPFESGGTDAFGVSLGEVYSMMDPAGDIPDATDLGVLT